jgi:hypothetical protein
MWEKVARCGPSQIAAITGDYGADFSKDGGTNLFTINVLKTLQNRCRNLMKSPRTIYAKQEEIFKAVSSEYDVYERMLSQFTGKHTEGCGVLVTGFDPSANRFLSVYASIGGTNQMTISTNFDSAICSYYFSVLGETHFVPTLMRNPTVVPLNEQSEAFRETRSRVLTNVFTPESILLPGLLNIFQLHQKYAFAATKGQDKGWIGEPYLIYRLDRNGIMRLH